MIYLSKKTYRNIITYTYNRIEMSESNETKMLINNVQEESTTSSEFEFENWDDLDIEPNLLRGIYAYGFEKPSAIQKKAIKPIIMNRDIIAQAQSGTGKTATFTIGALSRINLDEKSTQVLILSPTRELSKQTAPKSRCDDGGIKDSHIGGRKLDRRRRLWVKNRYSTHYHWVSWKSI